MTREEFDSAVSTMIASSTWVNGGDEERESLTISLLQSFDGIWEQVGDWWADLWNQFKEWILPPKNLQNPVSEWFGQWWAGMFHTALPWSIPPVYDPNGPA